MVKYIVEYAKSEKVLKFVYNRNLNRHMDQHLTVGYLVYRWVFLNCYRRANNMLIVMLYKSMISVGPNNFDGAKGYTARQILILP